MGNTLGGAHLSKDWPIYGNSTKECLLAEVRGDSDYGALTCRESKEQARLNGGLLGSLTFRLKQLTWISKEGNDESNGH